MRLPGGGGFWPPVDREPAAVLRDVIEGKVSIAAAAREYGVVVVCRTPPGDAIALPDDYSVDCAATADLRARMSGAPEPSLPVGHE